MEGKGKRWRVGRGVWGGVGEDEEGWGSRDRRGGWESRGMDVKKEKGSEGIEGWERGGGRERDGMGY